MVIGALVATTLDFERFERPQPGEGRRESRTRYSKVGNAGEANTSSSAYVGTGVYRLTNPQAGEFTTANRVGGAELESTFIGKLRFDGIGNVYAATSRGVWKHAANANAGAWTRVLYPVPDPPNPADQSAYNNICNDVAIQPNRGRQHVLANCAWRDGAAYNGFYYSVDGGASFARINPTGG
jgi:hypothetical protein